MEENRNAEVPANLRDEISDWMFSIAPVGVAFAFYIVFILYAKLENSHLYIAFGAAAAIVGLQSYWVMRGLRKGHTFTVILGSLGVLLTGGLLYLYLQFFG